MAIPVLGLTPGTGTSMGRSEPRSALVTYEPHLRTRKIIEQGRHFPT